MLPQTVQIEVPKALLDRAHVSDVDETRRLVASLFERYAQSLDSVALAREYEAYYTSRSSQDEEEEAELLKDFAWSDSEGSEDS